MKLRPLTVGILIALGLASASADARSNHHSYTFSRGWGSSGWTYRPGAGEPGARKVSGVAAGKGWGARGWGEGAGNYGWGVSSARLGGKKNGTLADEGVDGQGWGKPESGWELGHINANQTVHGVGNSANKYRNLGWGKSGNHKLTSSSLVASSMPEHVGGSKKGSALQSDAISRLKITDNSLLLSSTARQKDAGAKQNQKKKGYQPAQSIYEFETIKREGADRDSSNRSQR